MELPEQTKKIPFNERREMIKALAGTLTGQALREEIVDIMNDVGNVNKIPDYLFESNEVLASETRGMRKARGYLQGVYNMLLPEEVKDTTKKTHR
jgi:hypothetical protein